MGEMTAIAWTDSTINVWHGCAKVSPGCTNCYAEVSTPVRVKRAGGLELWGKDAARSETKGWETDLRKWNAWAGKTRKIHRVFAQSLSDTFEDRGAEECVRAASGDTTTLRVLREHFFTVVESTSSLTYQLLTKRPENILRMVPPSWLDRWPAHVWIGATVEDQQRADERIPHLLRVPAPVRFLSVEPMLEPVNLLRWMGSRDGVCEWCGWPDGEHLLEVHGAIGGIAWVIVGGESGPKARPFDLAWARSIVAQCRAAKVACFVKHMGDHAVDPSRGVVGRISCAAHHGADPSGWEEELRVQQFPEVRG